METQDIDLLCRYKGVEKDGNRGKFWKTCTWSNSDGDTCTYDNDEAPASEYLLPTHQGNGVWPVLRNYCDGRIKDANLTQRNRKECRIVIPNAKLKDTGNWTCRLERCRKATDKECSGQEANTCTGEATVYILVLHILSILIITLCNITLHYDNSK